MTDVIVLDEADRMIQDGHFKEVRDILAHIYTNRLRMKTKKPKSAIEETLPEEEIIKSDQFTVGKECVSADKKIDWSKVKDLYDDDEILDDMQNKGIETEDPEKPGREDKKRNKKLQQKQIDQLADEKFTKEYIKAGGIQHIICSATLTIDK